MCFLFFFSCETFLFGNFSAAVSSYVPLRVRFRSVLPILLEVRRWSGGGSWWVTLPRWSTGARARCCSSSCPHHRRLPPPPPPPPSPCPFYVGSPVHSSASTTGSPSFACPYQSGSISERSFFIPHQNDRLPHCGPLTFCLLFLLLRHLLRFSSFSIFLALLLRLCSPPFSLVLLARISRSLLSSHAFLFRFLRFFFSLFASRDFLPTLSLYSFPAMVLACLSILFFSSFCLSSSLAIYCIRFTMFFVFFISQSCRLRFPMHALFRDIRRPIAPFTVIRHSMLPSSSLISCRIRHTLSTQINQRYAVSMFSKIRSQWW